MSKRLEDSDRNILTFRPNIVFIEPDQEPGEIEGTDQTQLEDVLDAKNRIRQLANAVDVMATAMQARADKRANGLVIDLDPNADQETIQAMRRAYPDADPTKITYDQYRACRDGIRNKGLELGKQPLVTNEEIENIRNEIDDYNPGGFGTPEAKGGGLRPEVDPKGQIIEPINVEEVQINLICILVNFIWKNFILKAFEPIGIPGVGNLADALPKKLCNPGSDIEIPGLFILGDPPDDLLTGKVAEQASELLDL